MSIPSHNVPVPANPVPAAVAAPVAAVLSGPVAAPVAVSAPAPIPAPVAKPKYGLLPVPKTITITLVPDWNQEELRSPLRAASLCVLLGTANTLPHQANWCFEFNIFSVDESKKIPGQEAITKEDRALIWFNGKPNDKFKNCIVEHKTRLSGTDDLRTQSVVVRTYTDESDPNALVWIRKRAGARLRKDLSYLKVLQGHHYYFNITFSPGSNILQMVGEQSWRPIMYLFAKRLKKGVDEVQSTRLFTNFTTNWASGVELPMDQKELKAAQEALKLEREEEGENTAPSEKPMPPAPVGIDHKVRAELWSRIAAPIGKPETPPSIGKVVMTASSMEMLQQLFKSVLEGNITLDQIKLPDLDSKSIEEVAKLYNLGLENISLEPTVEKFLNHNECFMAHALFEFETAARAAAQNEKNPVSAGAKLILNLNSAVTQLPGWLHVQHYIYNPQQYIENSRLGNVGIDRLQNNIIAESQFKGNQLMQRLIGRLIWVIDLQNKSPDSVKTNTTQTDLAFDAEFALKVLAVDDKFLQDASAFMKEAELKVTMMLTQNPQKFHAFRELQRKGVQWPHSTAIRQEMEAAGFVFRPMMIKRDRCICETCGVEVSGWRVWHLPLGFHNYAKHPATFRRLDERRRVIASNPESRPAVALAPVAPAAPGAGSAAAGSAFALEKPESLKDMKKGNK